MESALDVAASYFTRSTPGCFLRVPKIAGVFATDHFFRLKALTKGHMSSAQFTEEGALPAPAGVTPAPTTQQKQY
jgi:hypothetical protein